MRKKGGKWAAGCRGVAVVLVVFSLVLIVAIIRQQNLIVGKNRLISQLRKRLWEASGDAAPSLASLGGGLPPPSTTYLEDAVPRIIHQMAGANTTSWPASWNVCRASWLSTFPSPEFTHRLWDDAELDAFMKQNFAAFYPTYTSLPQNINRIDMARYFILYLHGGVYADMDMLALRNFFPSLPAGKVSVAESPWKREPFQNALMASPARHPYWHYIFSELLAQSRRKPSDAFRGVVSMTGPYLINAIRNIVPPNLFHALPRDQFSPPAARGASGVVESFAKDVFTAHLGTCSWCPEQQKKENQAPPRPDE